LPDAGGECSLKVNTLNQSKSIQDTMTIPSNFVLCQNIHLKL